MSVWRKKKNLRKISTTFAETEKNLINDDVHVSNFSSYFNLSRVNYFFKKIFYTWKSCTIEFNYDFKNFSLARIVLLFVKEVVASFDYESFCFHMSHVTKNTLGFLWGFRRSGLRDRLKNWLNYRSRNKFFLD